VPLFALARSLSKVRALSVGDLVADEYIFGQTERISREAPVLIVRYESSEVRLGGGANAAHNAAGLGAKVRAIGILGNDELGRALKAQFKAAKIDLQSVSSPQIPTETKTRILAGGISTSRQQMLRLDRGANGQLPTTARRALAAKIKAGLKGSDVAMVSDYGAGVLDDETRAELLKWSQAGGTLVVDARFALDRYRGATYAKPNEPELSALTGMPVRTDDEVLRAAGVARKSLRCKGVLVTRGRKGMAWVDDDSHEVLIPRHGTDEIVDVTGAGDTVLAVFALGLGTGAKAVDAARLANVAASIVVGKQGTATVSPAELAAALDGVR
jgi:D-glycero-beta-D-manno-heptose-7-phosphate kinase